MTKPHVTVRKTATLTGRVADNRATVPSGLASGAKA